ncbi:MAG: diadenylate cyclase CdaA [Proteobacteria bacterium]|nr:diadenylate cyclase CdaA [Pseudomonadota bacterium]
MREIIEQFSWWSALDILIIAVLVYHGLLLLRGTRAAQMLTGILLLAALASMSSLLPFTTLHWLMSRLYPSFLLIIIIIFQDDIRHMLSTVGRRPLLTGSEMVSSGFILDEISRAAAALAAKRIGALIVIERDILMTRYVEVGITIDAKVSKELLLSIFHPSSPIHDGAVVIQRGRVAAAGCFLPLTRDENVDSNLGTRHRAAIGISQESDAVVVIVSEEGASTAVVIDGQVKRMKDQKGLREFLGSLLTIEDQEDNQNSRLKSVRHNVSEYMRRKVRRMKGRSSNEQ